VYPQGAQPAEAKALAEAQPQTDVSDELPPEGGPPAAATEAPHAERQAQVVVRPKSKRERPEAAKGGEREMAVVPVAGSGEIAEADVKPKRRKFGKMSAAPSCLLPSIHTQTKRQSYPHTIWHTAAGVFSHLKLKLR
jgi:hypothetical protein